MIELTIKEKFDNAFKEMMNVSDRLMETMDKTIVAQKLINKNVGIQNTTREIVDRNKECLA